MQKRVSGALMLHMLNTVFYAQLEIRQKAQRKIFSGIIMGMDFSDEKKSRRVYVQLDNPAIEVKVYGEDLDYEYRCRYAPIGWETFNHRGSTVQVGPLAGSFLGDIGGEEPPIFRAGDRVQLRVADYAKFFGQTARSRWVFEMQLERKDPSGVSDERR